MMRAHLQPLVTPFRVRHLMLSPQGHTQQGQGYVPARPDDADATYQCTVCDYLAPSFRLLRVHLSTAHGQKASHRYDAQRFRRELHSVDGMPTCRLCGHAFPRWTSLRARMVDAHAWALQRGALPALPLR